MNNGIPKTIPELIDAMESMFQVGVPTWYNRAVTGEEYVSFSNNGIHEQGKVADIVFVETEDQALTDFYNQFLFYVTRFTPRESRDFKLYWRRKPEIDKNEHGYKIVVRFLISDKPVDEKRLAAAPDLPNVQVLNGA